MGFGSSSRPSQAARALGIPTTLPSGRGVLLSFDDGPHPQGTLAVLAELDRVRAPAVFFVSGEQAARHPELVREIAAAGQVLALHGHRFCLKMPHLSRMVVA